VVCHCVNCEQCRAAPALHFGRPNWLELSSVDADLLGVVLAWEKIFKADSEGDSGAGEC